MEHVVLFLGICMVLLLACMMLSIPATYFWDEMKQRREAPKPSGGDDELEQIFEELAYRIDKYEREKDERGTTEEAK